MKKKKRTENITEHAARLCEAMYEDMLYELKLIVNISFFVPPPPQNNNTYIKPRRAQKERKIVFGAATVTKWLREK